MDNLILMPAYESYKNSGIDWLGNIPSSWNLKPGFAVFTENKRNNKGMKESTVLSLSYGNIVIKPEEKLVGLVPESFETYQLVEPNDIIIRCTDLQNDKVSLRTGLAKDKGIITSAYLNLRVKDGFNPRFLHYYLYSLDTTKVLYKFGSGLRQNLSFLDFKRLPVFDIPESTQIEISNFLDKKIAQIDEVISIKEQQISLLKERKQIIIQKVVTQGLNPNLTMKKSGVDYICEIPEHWEVKQSRFIFRVVRRTDRKGDEIKYSVTQAQGLVPTSEMVENSTQAESFDTFQLCNEGDLVLNKYKAHLGVFWKAPRRGIITNNYTVFAPLGAVSSKYFELLFHTPMFIEYFKRLVYGVTEGMSPLYTNDFYNMKTIVPPINEQLNIENYVENTEKKFTIAFSSLKDQISYLREYKSTLINSAVTGKIKITSAIDKQ